MGSRRLPSCPNLPAVIFLVLMCMACQLANSRPIDLTMEARFERWIIKHKRVYENATEKARRFSIFKANVEYIDSANAKEKGSLRLGANQFTDLTNEEYNSMANGCVEPLFSPDEEKMRKNKSFRYANVTDAPNYIDWRRLGAVTPVKDQMKCGSGWAFATVAAMEGITKIKTGKLISLSEQELVDCDGGSYGCKSGYTNSAFRFISENGLTDEYLYPYRGVESFCDTELALKINAAATIRDFEYVPANDELALMKAVAKQPVTVTLDITHDDFKQYKGGIYKGTCRTNLRHSVTVVGYGTHYDGTQYWLVKNSWGKNWGLNGYMKMRRNGPRSNLGWCGITWRAIYPIA